MIELTENEKELLDCIDKIFIELSQQSTLVQVLLDNIKAYIDHANSTDANIKMMEVMITLEKYGKNYKMIDPKDLVKKEKADGEKTQ